MHNYLICLKAMFKNKLRPSAEKSKGSFVAFMVLLGVAYALIMAVLLSVIVWMRDLLSVPAFSAVFYFFILMTVSIIVLIFGIVHLVSTLYLSKDTDFYSMLPVKASTVFLAKLSFVYIFETALVAIVELPLLITFGAITGAWAGFYPITLLTLFVVPALPLLLAAIFSVPIMFIASKLKNRNIIALVFYLLLFGVFFGIYIYFLSAGPGDTITEESMMRMLNAIETVGYVFYPFSVLANAACGIPSFGLGVGASTAVNLVIFFGISAVFAAIIVIAAKYMYAQSVKANNQTYNSATKKGEYKTSGGVAAMIKREYISSLRTTQTAFQCYAVMLLPLIFSIAFGIMFRNSVSAIVSAEGVAVDKRFFLLIGYSIFAAIFGTLGNGCSTTFSREGSAMASLKTLPMKPSTLVRAKVSAWLIFAVPVAAVTVTVFSVFMFDAQSFLLALFSLVPLTVALLVFGALWDLSAPKLKWTDPMQAIKHNGHVTIGQLFQIGAGLAIMALSVVLFVNNVSFDTVFAVYWALIYTNLAVFTVADILLYRRVEKYYNRIEI